MRKILLTSFFAVVIWAAAAALPVQASCPQHDVTDLLKFAIAFAPTDFSQIRGEPLRARGGDYELTAQAEAYCPHRFILTQNLPNGSAPESWILKFAAHRSGSLLAVSNWIVATFNPILKAKGYARPTRSTDDGDYFIDWEGIGGTRVEVATWADSDDPTVTKYEIYVKHSKTI